ncbi:MAG: ThiF family adenylyltransferase [Lachnospiraceae bacterium]|nr:ThiF family adenylyltransferase [Lachnospiraceae bacterium]
MRKDKAHVYLTTDTIRGIMLEVSRHPRKECIIQMPGVRYGDNFYFDLVSDSGVNATYTAGMCEKDHEYCDHLSTRIAEYYDFPIDKLTVSQVHKHPPGYDRFSPGDAPANTKLAKQFGGVVNGLILVDPEFRLKFWYIDKDGNETEVEYTVDDAAVKVAMPKKSLEALKNKIEQNEEGYVIKKYNNKAKSSKHIDMEKRKNILTILRNNCMQTLKREGNNTMIHNEAKVEKRMEEEVEELDFEGLIETMRPYMVFLPKEYFETKYSGALYGYYIEESKTFNVVTKEYAEVLVGARIIGKADKILGECHKKETDELAISVVWNDEDTKVLVNGDTDAEVIIDYYSLQKDVFSRNQGILESDLMSDKQAIIAGVGSGGFFVGLELVKAGIGSVIVADDDCFKYHNICRHVCGIHDVGKYKVDCFRERAADINPSCKVYTFRELIQHVDPAALDKLVWDNSIILSCADNRHAGYVCNELADKYHIPMVDAGCGPRASTGEVFYYKPDCGMPCYTCAYGEDVGVDYSNQEVRRKYYATESELEKMNFQPGISSDIEFTAIFETKLAIDLLLENEKVYEPKLLPYISQCTVILNYPVDKEVNPYMHLFENEKRPITWKTGSASKNEECSYCSNN